MVWIRPIPSLDVCLELSVDDWMRLKGPNSPGSFGAGSHQAGNRTNVCADIDGIFPGLDQSPDHLTNGEINNAKVPKMATYAFAGVGPDGQPPRLGHNSVRWNASHQMNQAPQQLAGAKAVFRL